MRFAMLFCVAAVACGGADTCARCHPGEASHYQNTAMSKALEPVASCDILKRHPRLAFKEGGYSTAIVRDGERSILTVTQGAETFSAPLLYAFGLGKAGQTYVFEHDHHYYESRASFFEQIQGLDLTMGAQNSRPSSIEEAAGRRMDAGDAKACFGCHTHGPDRKPGVGCESCHGETGQHTVSLKTMNKLATLSTEELSDLCGTCHRTWSHVAMNGPRGVNNVRFQPYRLTNSKCYDAADARIRCTACHDPHQDPVHEASFYDAKCGACHQAGTCKVGAQNCASCHMPKIELPGAHSKFTDHQIRIARANDPYPN